jgi:tRNA modification GTPase
MYDDTIAALSTPKGRGGIAVIRICGKETQTILKSIIYPFPNPVLPNKAFHSYIIKEKKRIDECVVVYFKAPHSYTGEDLAEISVHSNPFMVEEILSLIFKNNARGAMPGEFTYRAFKNGKMDLIQAESVNEFINANSKYYAFMKFGSLEGKLSNIILKIKENLIQLGIKIETRIEFEEDQYLEGIQVNKELENTMITLEHILQNSRFNSVLDQGLNIVVTGKVNVGKSSLFNTLLMQDRSIISSIPGTTRDFIKEKIYIKGFPIDLTDVAGINQKTHDDIEAMGIERSLEKIANSEAVIFMLDSSRPLEEIDFEIYQLIRDKRKLMVVNKTDVKDQLVLDQVKETFKNERIVEISVKQNRNIRAINAFLEDLVENLEIEDIEFTINQRQKHLFEELSVILKGIDDMVRIGTETELIAEEVRRALEIIGSLMGEVTTDDLLEGIFSEFCVGK